MPFAYGVVGDETGYFYFFQALLKGLQTDQNDEGVEEEEGKGEVADRCEQVKK